MGSTTVGDAFRKFSAMAVHIFRLAVDWEFANWVVGVLLALASMMLAIDSFRLAIVFLLVSGIWSAILWWRSKHVRRQVRVGGRYRSVPSRRLQCGGLVIMAALYGVPIYLIHRNQMEKELHSLHGFLIPDSDPMPNGCAPAGDQITMYLGARAVRTAHFPLTVVRVRNSSVLVVNRTGEGNLGISLEIKSVDGKIVAKVDDNEFVINQNNYFDMKRPDRSSLTVLDQYGAEVLNARYMNVRAFSLSAKFQSEGVTVEVQKLPAVGVCFDVPKDANPRSIFGFD